ncbi:hypothetical protein [Micromonospora sp. CPCC 206061]|uniref:hypothetical protein n=1 Tax=Micromonospora sp. CPCC 206061 TaxID=3122410 RepID=UPI002FEFFE99
MKRWRTTPAYLGEGIRRIAATAAPELGALAPRLTPSQIQVVDLTGWYELPNR